jgi:hypothetical protein
VGNYKVVSVAFISTDRGLFIGVQGGVTDLVKSVTCQVVAGRPSHMADRPWSSASTDLQLGIPLYRLLESVTVKRTRERLQGGASRSGGLAGRPPLGPLVNGLYTLPPRARYTLGVTLILVKFQFFL